MGAELCVKGLLRTTSMPSFSVKPLKMQEVETKFHSMEEKAVAHCTSG